MQSHRTTARGGLLLILAALAGFLATGSVAGAAQAQTQTKAQTHAQTQTQTKTQTKAQTQTQTQTKAQTQTQTQTKTQTKTQTQTKPKPSGLVAGKPIVFPLIGDYAYTMNFGDPRWQGAHEGIDIEHVPWRTPVVAAEAGTIKWWTTSASAGCMLYLYGKSGTTYLYIHLNNDLTDRSEDRGGCKSDVSYTVPSGAKVTAGQQIAWSGDSGDAEGNYHLHFEVHPEDGAAVNPYPYLNAGTRLVFPGRLGTPFALGVRGVPVEAGAGTLRLRATAVRWWPGGQWTSLVRERLVTLKVTGDASIDETLVTPLQAPTLEAVQTASTGTDATYTAFTSRGRVTAAALEGKPGTLVAVRVTRPGGVAMALGLGDGTDPETDPGVAAGAADDPSPADTQAPGLPGGV